MLLFYLLCLSLRQVFLVSLICGIPLMFPTKYEQMLYLLIQKIQKMGDTQFCLCRDVRREARTWGLVEWISGKFGGLLN